MNKYLPISLSLDDVLLVPQYSTISSRSLVDISWKVNNLNFKLPLIAANMDTVTGVDMAIDIGKLGGLAVLPRFDTPEIQVKNVKLVKSAGVPTAAAVGIKQEEWRRLEMLVSVGVDHINIDVAHGHLESCLDFVRKVRNSYPRLSLSAGAVCTYKAAMALFKSGADMVKVGVGAGSICITRIQTGCGVPQFTAITECARAARKTGKIIFADGGIKNSGDIVKCLGAGASAVMCGNLLAGTDSSPGDIKTIQGKKYKSYNGSTSLSEKLRQVKNIRKDKSAEYTKHVEGVESLIPYRGQLSTHVGNLIAGVKSGLSYCGANNIRELWEKAEFQQVTSLGQRENGAHDVLLLP